MTLASQARVSVRDRGFIRFASVGWGGWPTMIGPCRAVRQGRSQFIKWVQTPACFDQRANFFCSQSLNWMRSMGARKSPFPASHDAGRALLGHPSARRIRRSDGLCGKSVIQAGDGLPDFRWGRTGCQRHRIFEPAARRGIENRRQRTRPSNQVAGLAVRKASLVERASPHIVGQVIECLMSVLEE